MNMGTYHWPFHKFVSPSISRFIFLDSDPQDEGLLVSPFENEVDTQGLLYSIVETSQHR